MKTTKHMTIRQKLNTEKAAGIVCTMPFIVGFLAFMIIPMCYIALLFLLRLQYFTAPYIYRIGRILRECF